MADIRAPVSTTYPNNNNTIFISPSISPKYQSNPGYTVMDMNILHSPMDLLPGIPKITSTVRFFEISDYIYLQKESFRQYDLESYFGMTLTNPVSIRAHIEKMYQHPSEYNKYMVTRLGY